MRHAEYTPKSNVQSETDIDKRLVSKCRAGESGEFTMKCLNYLCHECFICAHHSIDLADHI